MSEQTNSPNYVVSHCQHCDGHIEFDANQLSEERCIVPCPHCGLETKLVIPIPPQPQIVKLPAESVPKKHEGFFSGKVEETADGLTSNFDAKVIRPRTSESKQQLEAVKVTPVDDLPQVEIPISDSSNLQHVTGVNPMCLPLQRNLERFPKGTRVTITSTQCKTSEGQELLSLLTEILQKGLILEDGARRLKLWISEKRSSEITAITVLWQCLKNISPERRISEEKLHEIQCTVERILPKSLRDFVIEKRQTAQDNHPAEKWIIDLIREQGGTTWPGITRKEAYHLKEALFERPSEKQLAYIRSLGGFPSQDMTREAASLMIQQLLHKTKASERQIEYIRSLGEEPSPELSRADAEMLIPQLQAKQYETFAKQESPSLRQMMVLRFWNKTDLMQTSKWEVEQWLTKFYDEDSRRRKAWELFKAEVGDDGSQHDSSFVPLGAGENYLERVN